MTLDNIIYDLNNQNLSITQIANHLIDTGEICMNQEEVEKLVEDKLKELQQEIEADAYLSSMDCYYDNYCE